MDLPVADPWFVRERIDDTLTLISEPHVHPLLRCNVWHVRGRDRDLVVDTALGLAPLRHVVDRELVRPLLAVATHTHGDHVGGLHEFAERLVHRAEAALVGVAGGTTLDATQFSATTSSGPTGPPATTSPTCWSTPSRRAGSEAPPSWPTPPRPAGCSTRATWSTSATGRSRCCTSRATRRAASGCGRRRRASCSRATPCTTGRCSTELDGSDIDAYLATMRRLRDLPVTVVHGGHEPSFGRERLVELCDAYLARRG